MKSAFPLPKSERGLVVFGLLSYTLLLPLLVWLPTLFEHSPDVVSAAQAEGYNSKVAHLTSGMWILLSVVGIVFLDRKSHTVASLSSVVEPAIGPITHKYILPVLTVIGLAVLYFPPALAAYGTFYEEKIHLTNIHRMLAGDVPYRDFEFLYGPLMLYPAYWWMKLTSFSLLSLYWYVLVLEIIVFLLILLPIQKFIKPFWHRVFAYLIIASLYFNPMLGPNQNGLRKAAGVLLLIHLAAKPYQRRLWLIRGSILGLLLSYSQEFGAATAMGIAAIYGTLYLKQRNAEAVKGLLVTATVSAVTWIATVFLLMGPAALSYFTEIASLSAQFNAGEAAFRFFWTANSLAVFGLVALAACITGLILSRHWTTEPNISDLLLIGGLAYAAVMLKSGLSRSDQWHIAPAVLPLVFAFLIFQSGRIVPLSRTVQVSGIGLSVVLALTYSYGQYPIAKYVFQDGLLKGYVTVLSGKNTKIEAKIPIPYPATDYDTGRPSAERIELSQFLANPSMRERRVFTYGSAWYYPFRLGVLKAGHLTDDYIYGDQRGVEARTMLMSDPDVLILMRRRDYNWLLLGPDAPARPAITLLGGYGFSGKLRGLLSSPHYHGGPIEQTLKDDRWRRLVGNFVIETYSPVLETEHFVILER